MRPRLLSCVLLAACLVACGDGDATVDVGDARADQARAAAHDAGLDDEVADFLALVARGATATYQVTYPGPADGTELVVSSRPPDRRVDLRSEDAVQEVRLTVDGASYTCTPDTNGDVACERTDAFVSPPGVFTDAAVEDLTTALVDRAEDFTFTIETTPVAGIEAACLVTRLRSGRERPELGDGGTICVAPSGALLLVAQGDDRLEATHYSDSVPDDAFRLPDDPSS